MQQQDRNHPHGRSARRGAGRKRASARDPARNHPGTGSYDYDTFVGNLDRSGYSGRVSVEIMHEISDIEKADSPRFLRSHWAETARGR